MYFREVIEANGGPSNLMFLCPFRPLHDALFMRYTSSSDPEILLPAVIDEDRYKVEEGYKVTLQCMVGGFGKTHFYQSDLQSMIRTGSVVMFRKVEME